MADHAPASMSSTSPEAKLLDHNYDGIREFDNPMPFWWVAIFWGTIFFSAPYFVFYHLGAGSSLAESYETEVGEFYEAQAKALGNLEPNEATIITLMADPKKKAGAQVMFRANCAVCHGPEGGGRTGPNLTDDSYINIKKAEDFYRVIHDGVLAKGMPEWSKRFSQPQLVLLASYVANLRGTHPADAKAADGSPIAPWPKIEAQPADAASNGAPAASPPAKP